MTPTLGAAVAMAVLGLVQLVLMWRLARSSRVTAEATTRVAQLTAALELLTDTTEAGFVNVAGELGRLGATPAPMGRGRRATTRRIASAARRGTSIEEIATAEALSESEVRLHLGLSSAATARTTTAAPEVADASEGGGVLDDLERWMDSLHRARRARGGRHAVVRV